MKAVAQTEIRTIAAGEFKAKCLKLMDEANEKQCKVGVTKRGKLVGYFVPVPLEQKPFRSIFGRSPAIQIPAHADWMKLKESLADEWDDSTKKLARHLHKSKSGKR